MMISPKVLIFSPSNRGGIAEHTFYQARALMEAGAVVHVLAPPSFLAGRSCPFPVERCLPDQVTGSTGLRKKLRMAWAIIKGGYVLAWKVLMLRPHLVLFDSFLEYLSPLWIDPHIILSRIIGFCYAANLHDPVRSYAIGPKWWHRLSVWLAYQPLDFVLVHHELADRSIVPKRVCVVVAPHGLYDVNLRDFDPRKVRDEWGIAPEQKVFISFGYVRDGKNLDLAIRALKTVPEAVLVVAGSVASTKDKPFAYYRELAAEVGVADRCRFHEGFVSDEETGHYFAVADFILLTYSAAFHSQSGVLNLAAKARKPVLASASPSPMIEAVTKYRLGLAVAPDSQEGITSGMKSIAGGFFPQPDWEGYGKVASWNENARRVLSLCQ